MSKKVKPSGRTTAPFDDLKPLDCEKPVFYSSFKLGSEQYNVADVVFLNTVTEENFTEDEMLHNYWIGVIDCIFVDAADSEKEVLLGVRWFYKKRDIELENIDDIIPADYNRQCDELIFSDHLDINPAVVVRGHVNIQMVLDTVNDPVPKMQRTNRDFACRMLFFTKTNQLVPLARALALDGETPHRALILARMLTVKSLGALVEPPYATKSATKKRKKSVAESLAPPKKKKKKSSARYPTFEEAQKLLVTRGEVFKLSSTDAFEAIVGCFVLLKHKNSSGSAVTTMFEICDVPKEEHPYRSYNVSYRDQNNVSCTGTSTAGVELYINDEVQRRSIVNLRDRDVTEDDYNSWLERKKRSATPTAHFPVEPERIAARIEALDRARKEHVGDTVWATNK